MTRRMLLIVCVLGVLGCKKPTLPNSSREEVRTQTSAVPVVPDAEREAAPAVPVPAPKPKADTKGNVIVLCYHRFEEKPKDSLGITPAAFDLQMKGLKDGGFEVIPMQTFLAWRRGEQSIPEKSCVITIDDGYRSGYDVAWPILKRYGYPFTMFVYTAFVKGGALAGGASLSWAELAQMRDEGVDIQSHTVNHQSLRVKKGRFQNQFPTYEEWLRHEIFGSKQQIEAKLGISVNALAYPYGIHSDVVRAMAMEAGYEAAFSTYGQRLTYHSPADQLGRYAIESTKPKVFLDALGMVGGGGSGEGGTAHVPGQLAVAAMLTEPMEGEVVNTLKPAIRVNLASLGEVENGTVEIRVSGVGAIPVKYDPGTKLAVGTLLQPLKERHVTVLLSALVNGRKVETRWTFECEAAGGRGGAGAGGAGQTSGGAGRPNAQ